MVNNFSLFSPSDEINQKMEIKIVLCFFIQDESINFKLTQIMETKIFPVPENEPNMYINCKSLRQESVLKQIDIQRLYKKQGIS